MSVQHRRRIYIIIVVFIIALLIAIFLFAIQHNDVQSGKSGGIFHQDNNVTVADHHSDTSAKVFQVGADPVLLINGRNSNVDVHSGDTGSITVQVHAHNSSALLNSSNASIRYAQVQNKQGHDQVSIATDPGYQDIDYSIAAPATTNVQIVVDGGNIAVSGVGALKVDAGSGSLNIDAVKGPVNVSTDSGDINVRDTQGATTITGQSGSVHLTNVTGQVVVTTLSGDVTAQNAQLNGHSALQTTNGSVRFNGVLDPHGAYKMVTTSGDITLQLPANAAFHLNTSTNSGNVNNQFPGERAGGSLRPPLEATVGNGSISIEKMP